MRWAFLLLLPALSFGATTEGLIRGFVDVKPHNSDFADLTYGESPNEAWVLLHTDANAASRAVTEFPLAGVASGETSTVTIYIGYVYGTPEIEVYAYQGDGVVESSDASAGTLVGSQVMTENMSVNALTPIVVDISTQVDAALAAGASYIGVRVSVKDDVTTADEYYATFWTGYLDHPVDGTDAPTLTYVPASSPPSDWPVFGTNWNPLVYWPHMTNNPQTSTWQMPTLGSYSVPGVCQGLHDGDAEVNNVTIGYNDLTDTEIPGETLQQLFSRGRTRFARDFQMTVPWDYKLAQCDRLFIGSSSYGTYTLRGTVGPNGEVPRAYCRPECAQCTGPTPIPVGGVVPAGENTNFIAQQPNVAGDISFGLENFIVDGYSEILQLANQSISTQVRNIYAIAIMNDGIQSSSIPAEEWPVGTGREARIEICGSEFTSSGNQTVHPVYVHGVEGVPPTEFGVRVWAVDNWFHGNNSNQFKSTANGNTVANNRFDSCYTYDPELLDFCAAYSTDVSGCADNYIYGNSYYLEKDPNVDWYTQQSGDGIGIRNRRSMWGCHYPVFDETPGSLWLDPNYWAGLNNTSPYETLIYDNYFERGVVEFANLNAIVSHGSYPGNTVGGQFSVWVHLEQLPEGWFERLVATPSNNTYKGFDADKVYLSSLQRDCYPDYFLCEPKEQSTIDFWEPIYSVQHQDFVWNHAGVAANEVLLDADGNQVKLLEKTDIPVHYEPPF